jgi:hypothetical protein
MADTLSTTCYLTLTPKFARGGRIIGFEVDSARKTKPTTGARGQGGIVISLGITMPRAAFEPLAPDVEITIPEGSYDIHPQVVVNEPEHTGGDD